METLVNQNKTLETMTKKSVNTFARKCLFLCLLKIINWNEFDIDFQEAKKVALTKSYNLLSTCVGVREADTFQKVEVELVRKFVNSHIENFRKGLIRCKARKKGKTSSVQRNLRDELKTYACKKAYK